MRKLVFFLALVALFSVVLATKTNYHGHIVYRVFVDTEDQLEAIEQLEGEGKIDVWNERKGRGLPFDIRVPPQHLTEFTQTLFSAHNTRYEVLIPNVQTLIDVEQERLNAIPAFDATKFLASNAEDLSFFDKYRNAEEHLGFIQALNQMYPEKTKLFTIGKTLYGKSIMGIKITGKPSVNGTKPAIVFNSLQHAREWISGMTVQYIAHQLLSRYDTDANIRALVDGIEWHLIPVVNVDGYEYTWTKDRLWRKNLRENQGSRCLGVDPNRNWDYKWDATGGSSTNPCSETYRGPKPFSEPESLAIANYTVNVPNLKAYIDFHSYSQLWMRPWGWTSAPPADEDRMKTIGDACSAAIAKTHGKKYASGRISIIIYPASGSSVDYVYGITKERTGFGATSFGVELRDEGQQGFLLDIKQIIPTGEENFAAAVEVLGNYVLTH
jgi:murein tripeptide amidase MpaA